MNRNLMGRVHSGRTTSSSASHPRLPRDWGYEIVDVYAPYPGARARSRHGTCGRRASPGSASRSGRSAPRRCSGSSSGPRPDWPANIGGKPLNSLPAFVPVAFETAVLAGRLGTVLLVLDPLQACSRDASPRLADPGVTDDRFVLCDRQETDAASTPTWPKAQLRRARRARRP